MDDIRGSTPADIAAIEELLSLVNLLTAGLTDGGARFFLVEDRGRIVGVGGLEVCGERVALVRSFAVRPGYRGRGIAEALFLRVIEYAERLGVARLYLLTAGAEEYFARRGFSRIGREAAPPAVRETAQFRDSCPASAVLMYRPLRRRRRESDGSDEIGIGLDNDPEENAKLLFDAGYYCAESVLLAVARNEGIDSPLIPAVATGFCSGVSRTSGTCGALTGGIIALNLVHGRDRRGLPVDENYAAVQSLVTGFEAKFGSTNCTALLGCDLGTPEGRQTFRDGQLRTRCREFTGIAARLTASLAKP